MNQIVQKRIEYSTLKYSARNAGRDMLMQYLSNVGEMYSVPKGTVIYYGDDSPQYCYYIIKGFVKVFDFDPSGQEFVYCVLKEKAFFLGESIILEQTQPCSYSALTDVVMLRCSYTQIKGLIHRDAAAVTEMFQAAVRTHREITDYIRLNATASIVQRISSLFLMYSEYYGIIADGECCISERISTRQIATLLGTSVMSITRAIQELKRENLVYYADGHYRLTNPEKLKEIAADDMVG